MMGSFSLILPLLAFFVIIVLDLRDGEKELPLSFEEDYGGSDDCY